MINWSGNGVLAEGTNLDNYDARPTNLGPSTTRLKCSGNEYELTLTSNSTQHHDEYGFRGSLPLELNEDLKRSLGSSSVTLTRKPMVMFISINWHVYFLRIKIVLTKLVRAFTFCPLGYFLVFLNRKLRSSVIESFMFFHTT